MTQAEESTPPPGGEEISIVFGPEPVNMDLVEEHFNSMFRTFVRRSDFSINPVEQELGGVTITKIDKEAQQVDMLVKYDDPMTLGLLVRKDDELVFKTNDDFDFFKIFKNTGYEIL